MNSEHSDTPTESIRHQAFRLLEKDHELKPKDLCKLMDLDYRQYGQTITQYRKQWKSEYRRRRALSCLSFHNTRGWVYALKMFDRAGAVARGWKVTRARNKMIVWVDPEQKLGRLEWHLSGRVNIWVKKPATWGRVKQLLANAFFGNGLVGDIQVFDLWANSARFKGSHLVYDTGERLPYSRIELLKDALGVVVKTGDVTHPTGVEIEFHYPDWAERNELLLGQNMKAFQQFSDMLKDLSQPKTVDKETDRSMIA